MTMDNSNSVLIDLDFFESRREVGEDFVEKLVQVFDREAPKLVTKIKATANENQPKELSELGHKLKGMCLNVGAERLSLIGKEIEHLAKKEEAQVIQELIMQLDGVLKSTLKEMKKLIR